jgi:hypothetical protein
MPVSAVASVRSPFTFASQVQALQGQSWAVKFELPPMENLKAQQWIAALLSLNGMQGTFLFGDSILKAPMGSAGGTPLVKGASQTGQTLVTDGWPVSTSGVLLAGDWIQIGSGTTQRLYKVLTNGSSNSSGEIAFDIWPRLRESPSDNAALTLSATKGVFRLKDNIMDWSVATTRLYGLTLEAIEAL